jgi:hypothetical protein
MQMCNIAVAKFVFYTKTAELYFGRGDKATSSSEKFSTLTDIPCKCVEGKKNKAPPGICY